MPQLEALGYVLKIREPNWYEHRVLKPQKGQKAHLHVFSKGCEEIKRMLVFRDWLRHQPEDKQRYEEEKKRLAQQTWKYVQDYADAKSDVVESIIKRANAA